MAKKITQEQQVIDALREQGGYATLGELYHLVDTRLWATKTPNETIRRIVQVSNEIFKIQPGLWALEECREKVLQRFEIDTRDSMNNEYFNHSYYQGLITKIGNMNGFKTYVPGQDKNKKFLDTPLVKICSTVQLPEFSYPRITNRARTVDVIWFNERLMPHTFFEVEHSTDFQNSLGKFCDLQDFYCRFFIVAPRNRRKQFEEILTRTAFRDICKRVKFNTYDDISKQYEAICVINKFNCI